MLFTAAMKLMIRTIFLATVFFAFIPDSLLAQRKVTTVGIQYKPIFPVSFIGTGPQESIVDSVQFRQELAGGFSGGMVIRKGLSDLMALEFGINYIKRKYSIDIKDGSFEGTSGFSMVGYELPLNLLVYIQLGERLYMNASMGGSLDMFASDVQSSSYFYRQVSLRKHIFQPALNANLGWEFRTEKSGYFYIGASYNRPFNYIYRTVIHDTYNNRDVYTQNKVLGSYLTLDLRYFFHEAPAKNKKTTIE